MKKQKRVPLFIENGDGNFHINPAYTGKERIIYGHYKKKATTSAYVLNPENRHAEARALKEVYERRERHLDELLRKGGRVVHVNITQEENPRWYI